MEEKESTISGSVSELESDSPSPVTSYSISATAAASSQPESFNINPTNTCGAGVEMMKSASPNTTTLATASGGQGTNGGDFSSGKKKRGRPRKYDSEGNLIIQSSPPSASGFSLSPATPNATKSSKKKAKIFGFGELLGSIAAWDFTPHILTVNTGEDVAAEILAFTLKDTRGICILSANGAVSNVSIRQPGLYGGLLTYEGRFEILSLTGSFVITETGSARNKTGGLSVSLAGPDGRVIGGGVAGILTAASPIQIVIGSFLPFSPKPQKRKYVRKNATIAAIASSTVADVSTGQVSNTKPTNETAFEGQQQQQPQIPNTPSLNPRWIGSEPEPQPELNPVISPDINVSAPSE